MMKCLTHHMLVLNHDEIPVEGMHINLVQANAMSHPTHWSLTVALCWQAQAAENARLPLAHQAKRPTPKRVCLAESQTSPNFAAGRS